MGKVVESSSSKKKKKKGRPSLLDLKKRSLLKEEQKHNPNPSSTPPPIYNSATPLRRNPQDDVADEDDDQGGVRKRKFDAIGDGSAPKGGNSSSGPNHVQEPGPATPLPDKKLLLFILDRLQKKDTYGVFSEPVDPDELPDYHEIIEHPMDFATVRDKVAGGAYATLDQFESDIFLICSNAMQYNAPDTIYFRQARSIHELAKKDFENLRQDSDDNEPEPKVVRRGRPPTKNLKKALQRLGLDRAGSELSSDATLAAGSEGTTTPNADPREVPHSSDKLNGSRSDSFWKNEGKFERNVEAAVSAIKGMKPGKKPSALEENRRNNYKQFHASTVAREPSVLTTFDAERKQLMAVGLMSEHGYARSLAQFSANIGSVAWKIASNKIGRSLPPGVEFGPGWVGENDIPPPRPLFPCSPSSTQVSLLRSFSVPSNQYDGLSLGDQSREENVQEKLEGDDLGEESVPPIFLDQVSSSPCASLVCPMILREMNGFNDTCGFSVSPKFKKVGGSRTSSFSFQPPQMVDRVSRTNANRLRPVASSSFSSGNPVTAENSSVSSLVAARPNSGSNMKEVSRPGLQPQSSWQAAFLR